jgi:hypothetical protein
LSPSLPFFLLVPFNTSVFSTVHACKDETKPNCSVCICVCACACTQCTWKYVTSEGQTAQNFLINLGQHMLPSQDFTTYYCWSNIFWASVKSEPCKSTWFYSSYCLGKWHLYITATSIWTAHALLQEPLPHGQWMWHLHNGSLWPNSETIPWLKKNFNDKSPDIHLREVNSTQELWQQVQHLWYKFTWRKVFSSMHFFPVWHMSKCNCFANVIKFDWYCYWLIMAAWTIQSGRNSATKCLTTCAVRAFGHTLTWIHI